MASSREARARCRPITRAASPRSTASKAAPILIHGDAAFTGQGIVSEVLNLQALPGYATGGTIHLIANNQIGFTTDPARRALDALRVGLGQGLRRADRARQRRRRRRVHRRRALGDRLPARSSAATSLIDLIGYRRFGHNEQDEPAYTQPQMDERIKNHPTVRELFANKLVTQGVLTAEQARAMVGRGDGALAARRAAPSRARSRRTFAGARCRAATPSTARRCAPVDARGSSSRGPTRSAHVPEGFTLNRKLRDQFDRRAATIAEKGIVDWGTAESLAFASLLTDGTPIRLTGQDTERGTFSHRHAVFHDPSTDDAMWIPLQHRRAKQASFEIHNSPLSEYACMGFEYGYSTQEPDALVLWEAQFGDFFNGAQIIIDQFIAAGQAKWGQTSRLTLLAAARLRRRRSGALERASRALSCSSSPEGNLRVAYPSTASNYYHLLRMQARSPIAVPLVVMTPKSLLRAESAAGTLDDMADGTFAPVIDDPRELDRDAIERLILCSGKIYHDLVAHDAYNALKRTAIARIELLAPLPVGDINRLIAGYPKLKKIVWVQEEPKNMGARAFVRRRLLEGKRDGFDIEYIGRGYRASPSEGYAGQHAVEQERIVATALAE